MTLVSSPRNGATLMVLPHVPHVYWPSYDREVMQWVTLGATLLKKVAPTTETFGPAQQLAWSSACLFLVYVVFRVVLMVVF